MAAVHELRGPPSYLDDEDDYMNKLSRKPTWTEYLNETEKRASQQNRVFSPASNGLGGSPASQNEEWKSSSGSLSSLPVSLDYSTRAKTPLQRARPGLLTILRCVLAFTVQVAIVNIGFCVYYSYVATMGRVFNEHDIWQACLIRAGGRFERVEDNSFVGAAAAFGLQVTVYSLAAVLTVTHAVQHSPSLLPSTLPMVVYQALAVFSFYSLQHILPFPTAMEATLVSLTKYVHPHMYSSLNLGSTCHGAYKFNLAYLALNYSCLAAVLVVFSVAVRAEWLRRLCPALKRESSLRSTRWPTRLSQLVLLGYVVQLVGKNWSQLLAIHTFQATVAPTYFPGSPPSLDPTTIFLVVTSMSVIRGTLSSSSSAFRLAAGSAVLYLATTWPGMVAAVTAFAQYELFTDKGCDSYIGSVKWGVPDKRQAYQFCYATRTSFLGEGLIFVAMHAQVVACVLTFSANRKGQHMGTFFNLAAPSNANHLLFSTSREQPVDGEGEFKETDHSSSSDSIADSWNKNASAQSLLATETAAAAAFSRKQQQQQQQQLKQQQASPRPPQPRPLPRPPPQRSMSAATTPTPPPSSSFSSSSAMHSSSVPPPPSSPHWLRAPARNLLVRALSLGGASSAVGGWGEEEEGGGGASQQRRGKRSDGGGGGSGGGGGDSSAAGITGESRSSATHSGAEAGPSSSSSWSRARNSRRKPALSDVMDTGFE